MSQLTRGEEKRVMYVECKDGDMDGAVARIGWVTFSRSGRSVYYRGRMLTRMKGGGVRGNYMDTDAGLEYWVSGVKRKGSNVHWAESAQVQVDEDALEEYRRIRTARDT